MTTIIETTRLILRPISLRDFKTACAYACDSENTKFMIYLSSATKFSVLLFLIKLSREWKKKNPHDYEFAVIEKSSGQHIGGMNIELAGEDLAEIGWVLAKDAHGKGYCTEGARALIAWAKENLDITKICAHADAENEPSINVMEKLGMKKCAIGTRVYKDGRTASEVMHEANLYLFTIHH